MVFLFKNDFDTTEQKVFKRANKWIPVCIYIKIPSISAEPYSELFQSDWLDLCGVRRNVRKKLQMRFLSNVCWSPILNAGFLRRTLRFFLESLKIRSICYFLENGKYNVSRNLWNSGKLSGNLSKIFRIKGLLRSRWGSPLSITSYVGS